MARGGCCRSVVGMLLKRNSEAVSLPPGPLYVSRKRYLPSIVLLVDSGPRISFFFFFSPMDV